jgi:hypothetical protein
MGLVGLTDWIPENCVRQNSLYEVRCGGGGGGWMSLAFLFVGGEQALRRKRASIILSSIAGTSVGPVFPNYCNYVFTMYIPSASIARDILRMVSVF